MAKRLTILILPGNIFSGLTALVLCALFFFTSGTFGQKPTNSAKEFKPERLSQNELNQLASKLATTEFQEYTHRTYRIDAKRVVKLDKQKVVRGLFLMRNPEFMKRLSNGAFDDKQGNLIYFGQLTNDQKQYMNYSLTFTAAGQVIMAFDIDSDGLVDGMIGRISPERFWGLEKNALPPALLQCLRLAQEKEIFGALAGCWGKDNKGGKTSAGKGFAGVASHPFDDFIDSLSNPRCSPQMPGDIVRDPPKAEVVVEQISLALTEVEARQATERAERAGNEAAATELKTAVNEIRRTREALTRVETASTQTERDNASRDYSSHRSAARAALGRAERRGGGRITLPETSVPTYSRRPIGPNPDENPLCTIGSPNGQGGGFLWRNKKFCGEDDMITCMDRAGDALIDFTQGRCRKVIGPADNPTILCKKKEDPLAPPDADPQSGPADGPIRFPVIPGVKVDYAFVDATPLGAILVVLCQVDACGGSGEVLKRATP